MRILPALLFAFALLIALCVQTLRTPLAGAWLFFFIISSAAIYAPQKDRGLIWWSALAWLFTLGLSTFIIVPVANGFATMSILAAMPIVALSLEKDYLKSFLIAALIVLTSFALVLIGEMVLGVHYTTYQYPVAYRHGLASAWPLLDPNNAACVINIGLIPCFYLGIRKPRWLALFAIFAVALFTTSSRTGALCAVIACSILAYERFPAVRISFWVAAILLIIGSAFIDLSHVNSWQVRLDIWKTCETIMTFHPWRGNGLGSFYNFYIPLRTEHNTAGTYAHNNLIQFAIEIGFPCTLVFVELAVIAAYKTSVNNMVSFCTMLAVFLHSLMEFQFYLPSVSLLMGLALAYHRVNCVDYKKSSTTGERAYER